MCGTPRRAVDPDETVVADLVTTACSGDRRAAARLLTLVERGGEPADAVAEATHPLAAGAQVVGITGAPGSGKSTLTDGLAASLAGAGRRPAVLPSIRRHRLPAGQSLVTGSAWRPPRRLGPSSALWPHEVTLVAWLWPYPG